MPELLAPAGSLDALYAAVGAGADAVYLGGSHLNARMNARNFDREALEAGVDYAHKAGARVYMTLNTMVYDRELTEALTAAEEAAICGVDGLIIADVGAALAIRQMFPELSLHASTQAAAHNALGGQALAERGFCRYVLAREASLEDIKAAVKNSGIEVEVFVHGALCVSHSGQCLFSSLVGGRSGNRGFCAQPCRLPYTAQNRRGKAEAEYPLSLKDLSLARHIPALIEAGVASLKIEGRMKSSEYVGGVVSVFRRLLDEHRGATDEEMAYLSELFSRDGFTDGYFCQSISPNMLGMRSEEAKTKTLQAEKQVRTAKAAGYLPIDFSVTAKKDQPLRICAKAPLFRQGTECQRSVSFVVEGEIPEIALNCPTDAEILKKQLSRLGGSDYTMGQLSAELDDGLMIPVSKLNAMRRMVVEGLDETRRKAISKVRAQRNRRGALRDVVSAEWGIDSVKPFHTARFRRPEQIPPEADDFFALIYLPLDTWMPTKEGQAPRGVILPPVIFDREMDGVKSRVAEVLEQGAKHFLLSNEGHLPMLREILKTRPHVMPETLVFHGDFRLNVGNRLSAAHLLEQGYNDLLLSPELTEPRLRDLCRALPRAAGAVVYGRMPLMLLEKCVITSLYPTGIKPKEGQPLPWGKCGEACAVCRKDQAAMVDRRGMIFPVLREYPHRNIVVNSLPLSMVDKADRLEQLGIWQRHYIFTVETETEVRRVIKSAVSGERLSFDVRRFPKA